MVPPARTAAVVFLALLSPPANHAGTLRFVRERIEVQVLPPETVSASGDYVVSNPSTAPFSTLIIYPLPVGDSSLYPFSISVVNGKRTVACQRAAAAVTFPLSVGAGDSSIFTVRYRQIVKGRQGRYILTTTSLWGAPLESGVYLVSIPSPPGLSWLSYEADTVTMSQGRLIYRFDRHAFMPGRDLMFRWPASAQDRCGSRSPADPPFPEPVRPCFRGQRR